MVFEWLETAARLPGVRMAPLSTAVCVDSTRLPGKMHGDPADRLIVATARHLSARLVTADRALIEYAAPDRLEVHSAAG